MIKLYKCFMFKVDLRPLFKVNINMGKLSIILFRKLFA